MRKDYSNGIKCISIGTLATMAELKSAILAAVQSLAQSGIVCAIKTRADLYALTTANFANDSYAINASFDLVGIVTCPYNNTRFVIKFTSPFGEGNEWHVVYSGGVWTVYKSVLAQA